jgi:drug/metabolite transporter (DMT)-like permease
VSDKFKSWFLLILLSIVWGSSYFLIRLGLQNDAGQVRLEPMQLGALRMFIAAVVLVPFFLKYKSLIQKKHRKFIFISGFFGSCIPAFLFAYAQTRLDSAVTGMLNSFVPIFAILIATLVFGFKMKINHILGMILGLFGATFIMYSKVSSSGVGEIDFLPFAAILAATLGYAISLNVIKYELGDLRPMAITSASFFIVGIPCLIYLLCTGFVTELIENPLVQEGALFVSILAVVGTSIAVYLFNHLIKLSSAIFASSVTYFIPVVATILGIMSHEEVGLFQVIGMSVLIVGVILINKKVKNVGN